MAIWKRENQRKDNNQGREKEKTQDLVKTKGGNSITSPNNNPGVCFQQARVGHKAILETNKGLQTIL